MKKLIVTSLFILFIIVSIEAQSSADQRVSRFTLGAFGGLNIPKLTGGSGNPLSENWSSRAGEAFGLTFAWNMNPYFGWIADILYSSEGGQRNGLQAIDGSSFNPMVPTGTFFYADFKNESVLNYLEVPVMAKYSFPLSKSTKICLDLGPYAGYLLSARQKTFGSSIVYADAAGTQAVSVDPETGQVFSSSLEANTKITDQIHALTFGFTGGIGCSQNIGFGEITLNVRGAYGLTNIQKNAQDGKNHSGNLLISLGYSIPL
jgi:hypothetical protein